MAIYTSHFEAHTDLSDKTKFTCTLLKFNVFSFELKLGYSKFCQEGFIKISFP